MARNGSVTVLQAARLLGISRKHTYDLVLEGKLAARKEGRVWRVSRAAITERQKQQRLQARRAAEPVGVSG